MKDVRRYTATYLDVVVSSIGTYVDEGFGIMVDAVINSDAQIGKHCIVNAGAIVEHDNVILDYAHISVGEN